MPAAGRVVTVDVDRLVGWVARFAARHGQGTVRVDHETHPDETHPDEAHPDETHTEESGGARAGRTVITIDAPDGAQARLAVPFGPLPMSGPPAPDVLGPGDDPVAALVDHVRAPRTIGILLVRRGGWAVGVVRDGDLLASATGGGHVQGTTKAGGWSQQRYARRRGHQAQQVWGRAVNGAATVLIPHRDEITGVLTGGDRVGITAVLADPRLTWLDPLREPRLLAVPDPTRSVLQEVVRSARSVIITLNAQA